MDRRLRRGTLRGAARFVERREGDRTHYDRVALTPAEVALECAKEADACEASYVAAFGPLEEDDEDDAPDGARDARDA